MTIIVTNDVSLQVNHMKTFPVNAFSIILCAYFPNCDSVERVNVLVELIAVGAWLIQEHQTNLG